MMNNASKRLIVSKSVANFRFFKTNPGPQEKIRGPLFWAPFREGPGLKSCQTPC